MPGEDGELECGGAQHRGGEPGAAQTQRKEWKELHGRPPNGTPEGRRRPPRVPSWGAMGRTTVLCG
ncbi:hypothetical protein GCM10010394_39710 [Streptomyces crystallinus]|uniref:Uncharacterized protein n=1 Tax=Streptomyces crystallinus TaxID=68191 RepID=A0ABP3RFK5_9ACTN